MSTNAIRPGFHWSQLFDLRGLPAGINLAGATVQANLVKTDDPTPSGVLIATTAQADGIGGADYAQNRVIVEFTGGLTAGAAVIAEAGRNALVQVFVTQFGKTHVYPAGIYPIALVAP